MKIDIKSMNQTEITAQMKELGEPAFRGKQIFVWLHKGVTSFDDMTNLSKSLREKLKEHYFITVPKVERKLVSQIDGTIKYLWRLDDGNCIETVLMKYKHGNSVFAFLLKWAVRWAAYSVHLRKLALCAV